MDYRLNLKIGTASGTLLSVMPNINSEDYVRTIVLAAVGAGAGAVSSYMISLLFKWIGSRRK